MKKLLLFLPTSLLLMACQNQPDCENQLTGATVDQLADQLIIRDLALEKFATKYDNPYVLRTLIGSNEQNTERLLIEIQENIQREINNSNALSSVYTDFIEEATYDLEKLNPQILNARTIYLNRQSRKCDCEADYTLSDGTSIPLEYSIKNNNNGDAFIKVNLVK